MDLNLLHLYMELSAAASLFFIAWLNWRYNATGIYSKLMTLGCGIAAVTDVMHATIPYLYPVLMNYWMPISWGAGRLTLILTFLMVFLCYDVIRCQLKNLALILSLPAVFVILVSVSLVSNIGDFSWAYSSISIFGITIYRPFDLFLLLAWITVSIVLRTKSQILFPPNVYWLFMSQGILIHTIMTFSSYENLDMSILIAHALKISEYYTFILIYLLYKTRLDHLPKKSYLDNKIAINNIDSVHHNHYTN